MNQQQHDEWQRERLLEALDSYRLGISDAPLLRKWSGVAGDAPGLEQGEPMAFVISTDEVDRHGDVIAADGWNLDSYRNNPVFLWAHDYARPVIGKAVDVWKESHRLMAKIRFAPTDFAQEVAALYETGYQRGVSVGFKPLKYEERRHEKTGAFLGIRFLEQELLEVSAVPVPANRNALRRALEQAPRMKEYLGGYENKTGPWAPPSAGNRTGQGSPGHSDLIIAGNIAGSAPGNSALKAVWPRLSAQVDELAKLVEELAETVDGAGLAPSRGFSPGGFIRSEVDQVLSVLRDARAPVTVGEGGPPAVLRR